MIVRLYGKPEQVGWLGWLEGANEEAIGFIRPNGSVLWAWQLK
jgi:hypothetical protein